MLMQKELETKTQLAARVEPFDSFWQMPDDIEEGYTSFYQFYKHNYLQYLPKDKQAEILIVSCGPGYFVNLLNQEGYSNVLGIDSDPEKVAYAEARGLNCRVERAFSFLENNRMSFDVLICEQELNHLTLDEMLEFLALCRENLKPGGTLIAYGLNGANPIVGAENLAHNIDHFNTFTDYSLTQILNCSQFEDIEVIPLRLYVFYQNPLNYVGMLVTGLFELFFKLSFALYGKKNKIFTKKIGAVARKSTINVRS